MSISCNIVGQMLSCWERHTLEFFNNGLRQQWLTIRLIENQRETVAEILHARNFRNFNLAPSFWTAWHRCHRAASALWHSQRDDRLKDLSFASLAKLTHYRTR